LTEKGDLATPEALDVTPERTARVGAPTLLPQTAEIATADYLAATASVAWLEAHLLAQIPTSAHPLVVADPDEVSVLYWEHTRYRQAIQDARCLGSRKPFLCGGLRSFAQLSAIDQHLTARQLQQGLDPYLSDLHASVQRAVTHTASLAADVEQAKQWLI